jgi:hypothetical protein
MATILNSDCYDHVAPFRGKEEIEDLGTSPWTKPVQEIRDFVMPKKKPYSEKRWSMVFPTCLRLIRRVLIEPYTYPLSYTISELSWTISELVSTTTELSWCITEQCICTTAL